MSSVKKTIKKNVYFLNNSQKRLKDVFDVIFSCPEKIMVEDAFYVGKRRYKTYGRVREEAEKVAAGIYEKTKSAGQYIGLYAENRPEWFSMFWGILMSGNYPYLINLRQPISFSDEMLFQLGGEYTIYLGVAPKTAAKVISYDALVSCESILPDVTFGDSFALSTSGTTLKKKICIYTGREITAQITNAVHIMQENSSLVTGEKRGSVPRQLVFLPLYHIFGLEAVFLWYSMWQSVFIFPPDMSPEHILSTIRDCRVTHIYSVPLFWENIEKSVRKKLNSNENLKNKFEKAVRNSVGLQSVCAPLGRFFAKRAFANIRQVLFGESIVLCITGGSAVKKDTLKFFNAIGYPLVNGYGMTELGITSVELSKKINKRLEASIGRPVRTAEYKIGENGQLCVKGESVCKKMIIDGQLEKNDGYFDTGDIMSVDCDGRFFIKGRSSDIVFGADGENLNPDFAEQIFTLPGAKNYVVMGDSENSRLMMIVELPENITDEQKIDLMSDIDKGYSKLPAAYNIYKTYFTYDALNGSNGIKVSRAYVRKALDEGRIKLFDSIDKAEKETSESADTKLKSELRVLVADILDIDEKSISNNAHFFNELGGSSLDYFCLLGKIDEVYGIKLDFEPENFRYSIDDIERVLSERLG